MKTTTVFLITRAADVGVTLEHILSLLTQEEILLCVLETLGLLGLEVLLLKGHVLYFLSKNIVMILLN